MAQLQDKITIYKGLFPYLHCVPNAAKETNAVRHAIMVAKRDSEEFADLAERLKPHYLLNLVHDMSDKQVFQDRNEARRQLGPIGHIVYGNEILLPDGKRRSYLSRFITGRD